jgi:hypothetical protein
MKKKTRKVTNFIEGLHKYLINHPHLLERTQGKPENLIQTKIRPVILRYLEEYFEKEGYKDPIAKANKAFYWEGQEGQYGKARSSTFGTKNYPDFIITQPYLIAIEYKKSPSGSTIKHGIGQSVMHTLCEEFHYVYFLFHDESDGWKIWLSTQNEMEDFVIKKLWKDFNVYMGFVEPKNKSKLRK